ncbi:DUF739 family protein [Vagococcus fluvialis]|uniref:DUF739 family protein n=1 Tax=Vagococcus fluvialis TaxID=2738 RepID=UPI001D0AAA95|nr:DUF739 family protein [Vagococcus fluvialis]UDM78900.1 DUF739 family protein [Vagococcus fluvialis]
MSFNYSVLLGRITEVYGTQYNFAVAIGMSERSLSLKLNNKVPWKAPEIARAIELLNFEEKDIGRVFFNQEVQTIELKK